ncbi:putative rRNA-processing protein utp23 [Lyophyllum shimeji]|uniref:Protein phosphatase n=1 Tax=Lyophyllum shimeji TaxID=47721 RepID=A0A9P3PWT5_LYOSH|nr:putative rRNA-processing protein utp23 [Lyophyllum shimeji]
MKSGIPTAIPSGIHKRLYTVLPRPAVAASSSTQHRPRPRSNSASLYTSSNLLPLSFFDSPPPPPSRLPPAPPRLPGEPKQPTNSNPNPLALTPSPLTNDDGQAQLLSSSLPYQYPSHSSFDGFHNSATPLHPRQKRPRPRYQLDVGAYGIPKRCRQPRRALHTHTPEPLPLAVQIGEDAYFVRENAMGVADGVGGWARTHPHTADPNTPPSPSPSALFARRLMHFTSAQLEPPLEYPSVDPGPAPDLDSHLAELSEGIDVLQIMERAYEQTVKAHVQPSTSIPLHTGSSTALVAVLDNVEEPVLKIAHIGDCMGMLIRGNDVVWRSEEMWWAFNTPVQLSPPARPPTPPPSTISTILSTTSNLLSHSLSPSPSPPPSSSPSPSSSASYLPFHPPPPPRPSPKPISRTDVTPVTPRNSAQVITLPVRPDDILILASDGLSDNLWDEDVLDEVVRFRRTWASGAPGPYEASCGVTTTSTSSKSGVQISTATATATDSSKLPSPGMPTEVPSSSLTNTSSLRRQTLAGMLSEALCSRARSVSERRHGPKNNVTPASSTAPSNRTGGHSSIPSHKDPSSTPPRDSSPRSHSSAPSPSPPRPPQSSSTVPDPDPDETPFARRAREQGRTFVGGKRDDISVLVAIVSPTPHSVSPRAEAEARVG